tara:strand:- start:260 stop:655 length:396 start_codon:yes stop_codon:yes gene_type:complete
MISKKLITFLLQWISLNTDYDASKFDFRLKIVESNELQQIVCGGKCPVLGFFSKEYGILLVEMNFENICNQSILLHEMIHSFQERSLENVFKEKEAYYLQNKFLEEFSLKNDMIEILNVKKCRSNQIKDLF